MGTIHQLAEHPQRVVAAFAAEANELGRFDPPINGYERTLLAQKLADGELDTAGKQGEPLALYLAGRLAIWRTRGRF